VAATDGVNDSAALPRLLYIGDVSVADTFAGEALLYRLLEFYPPERLEVICELRPDMKTLPGVTYHHWGAAFPALLHSRVAEEYILWRAWRCYEVPWQIANIAARFRPDAILTISHVSAWLCAWQLAVARRIPLHLIAHDDEVYKSRFPRWSHAWAERMFGAAYRFSSSRLCISDVMEERYAARYGARGSVIYPTYQRGEPAQVNPRAGEQKTSLTFGFGGSIHTAADIDQLIRLAAVAVRHGHRVTAFTPQHAHVRNRAAAQNVPIDVRAPVPSRELRDWFRAEADCLLLLQSMTAEAGPMVSTAFPSKWADYSTVGLPILVWAPPESSSARFVSMHPGCAELVTSSGEAELDAAIARLGSDQRHRRDLAEALVRASVAFSPEGAWQRFRAAVSAPGPRAAAS
jgi:hypothetical protein